MKIATLEATWNVTPNSFLNFKTTNVLTGERIQLEGQDGEMIDLGSVGRVIDVDCTGRVAGLQALEVAHVAQLDDL